MRVDWKALPLLAVALLAPRCALADDPPKRDRLGSAIKWWCTEARTGGGAGSMFCKTAALKEAIAATTDVAEKQAKVDELKATILRGEAEAEGLDATNPERQRMMNSWCESDDEARGTDPKAGPLCAKFKAKQAFLDRREKLLDFWCVEQKQAGSPKCKQMDFGKKMQNTDSGEERKRMAADFNAARTPEAQAALEEETKQMMHAVCGSAVGKEPLFATTCAKMHTEL